MEMEMEMEMEIEAGGGGFPAWMEADQRRRLQAAANETTAAAAAVVAADGSGDFRSIQAALDSWAGSGNGSGFTIHVKAGVYEEYIEVTKKMVGLTLVGDGVGKTIITGSKNYLQGITTSLTATVGQSIRQSVARLLDPSIGSSIDRSIDADRCNGTIHRSTRWDNSSICRLIHRFIHRSMVRSHNLATRRF
jgi:hypothetical protein